MIPNDSLIGFKHFYQEKTRGGLSIVLKLELTHFTYPNELDSKIEH